MSTGASPNITACVYDDINVIFLGFTASGLSIFVSAVSFAIYAGVVPQQPPQYAHRFL